MCSTAPSTKSLLSMPIKSRIRSVPDYPKKGILFRDITTLIKDPVGFRLVIDNLTQHYLLDGMDFDVIVGIEARGFIIGGALAYTLGKGFVPVRKPGKLPADVVSQEYELEYGSDKIEIHVDALIAGQKVLLVFHSLKFLRELQLENSVYICKNITDKCTHYKYCRRG